MGVLTMAPLIYSSVLEFLQNRCPDAAAMFKKESGMGEPDPSAPSLFDVVNDYLKRENIVEKDADVEVPKKKKKEKKAKAEEDVQQTVIIEEEVAVDEAPK